MVAQYYQANPQYQSKEIWAEPLHASGLNVGKTSDSKSINVVELQKYSILSIGSNLDIGEANAEPQSYINNKAIRTVTDELWNIEKKMVPLLSVMGRSDIMGGTSISTDKNDCVIGRVDPITINTINTNGLNDQTGSALIRSKGNDITNNIHKKTGLQVYHGIRLSDFSQDNVDFTSDLPDEHKSTTFKDPHDKLDNIKELSYVRDESNKKYFKGVADQIVLHSDFHTHISNPNNSLTMTDNEIKITSDQLNLNIENDIIIGNKESVHFRLATLKEDNGNVSLLINKYEQDTYIGNLLELGNEDEDDFDDIDFGSGSGTGTGPNPVMVFVEAETNPETPN